MSEQSPVQQLIQAVLDSGVAPEEACRADPSLLPAVLEGLRRLRAMEAELGVLFPLSASGVQEAQAHGVPGELPRLPGYEVLSVLGFGGMGVVYKAKHLRLDRLVAVKMLLAGAYASPAERARFMREAQAIAGLRHRHLVQVHDVGDLDGRPYFTMEYVEGGSLAQRLGGAPQPPRQAAAMVATLARAIQAAHDGGIIHRDLKPANILLEADGTPRISDFGLALRYRDGSDLTLGGVRLGTPCYMSPEQTAGRSETVGPSSDIYSLGAVLYEMLTGRPPFRADSAAETERQVIAEEPAPPSRLNARIPRDLNTICLKCLAKAPARRYESALALGEDLERFLRGEPVKARRAGAAERAVKWVRRRPGQAALLSVIALATTGALATALWVGSQRAAVARSVQEDLREFARREEAAEWGEARTALERAKARLDGADTPDLREQVEQGKQELELVASLEAIRLNRSAVIGGRFDLEANRAKADREYERLFREAGLGLASERGVPEAAGLAGSRVRTAVATALDDWAACTSDAGRQAMILEAARRADPDPGWRDRVRDVAVWSNAEALAELAKEQHSQQPAALLVAVGQRLRDAGGDASDFLRRVQLANPSDFWANFALGLDLLNAEPARAVEYFRAAVALRAQSPAAANNLGIALAKAGRLEEALAQFRRTASIDPSFAYVQSNLGYALAMQNRADEALGPCEAAARLDPQNAGARANLGSVLVMLNRRKEAADAFREAVRLRPDSAQLRLTLANALEPEDRSEAVEHLRRAIELKPTYAPAHESLGRKLQAAGDVDGAIAEYERARGLDPASPEPHFCLGSAYCAKRRFPEAIQSYQEAVRLRPDHAESYLNLGLACMAAGRPDDAIESIEHSLRIDGSNASAHYNLGVALEQKGRQPEAIERFREALRLNPRDAASLHKLGSAAMAHDRMDEAIEHFQQALRVDPTFAPSMGSLAEAMLGAGRPDEAKEAAERLLGVLPQNHPWRPLASNLIRRAEAQKGIQSRVEGYLKGEDPPESAEDRLELAELCSARGRFSAAARLALAAFTLSPQLADDLNSGARFNAARSAARAGCGEGEDALELTASQRARWRRQACSWLRADLALLRDAMEHGKSIAGAAPRTVLARWRLEPALTGVRDEPGLRSLAPDEQDEWRSLWAEAWAMLSRAGGGPPSQSR